MTEDTSMPRRVRVARELFADADALLAAGDHRAASETFAEALNRAFHRAVHFDRTASPLAPRPETFVTMLRDSRVAQRIRQPRGRVTSQDECCESTVRQPAAATPRKVLVATRGNANFLSEVLRLLAAHPSLEVRFVDFAGDTDLLRGVNDKAQLVDELVSTGGGMTDRIERALRPHLDWADVVFVEWCTVLAVLFTMVDPRDTRLIVRLHSYEVFTHWPHLMDFSRVDDLLFVSEHLRDLSVAAIPALQVPSAPRLHVLPLAKELHTYTRPKEDDARFTLGLVGWSAVAKDPLWALKTLRRLRAVDDRYRLLLIGSEFAAEETAATRRYAEELLHEIADLEGEGALECTGPTDDVPGALTRVGVILSASVRESFHAALVEGAASGAVPVVRDWPYFAGRRTSARTLFPESWVVDSPDAAVMRILHTTESVEKWRDEGAAAAALALETWDWSVTHPGYEALFLS